MKSYNIIDVNNGQQLCTIEAQHGKSALHKFRISHCLSTGMYEIHKGKYNWIMSSTFGSYFYAMEVE